MSYVVKAICYLDERGHGMPCSDLAKKYDDYELAELAAKTASGFVVKVEDGRILTESVKNKPPLKKKAVKANQAWMAKQ